MVYVAFAELRDTFYQYFWKKIIFYSCRLYLFGLDILKHVYLGFVEYASLHAAMSVNNCNKTMYQSIHHDSWLIISTFI